MSAAADDGEGLAPPPPVMMDAKSSEDDDNDAIASTVFIVLVLWLLRCKLGINSWGRSNSDEIGGVICRHYVLLVTKILVDFDGCVSKYTPRIEGPWGMGNERHFLESLSKGSYY